MEWNTPIFTDWDTQATEGVGQQGDNPMILRLHSGFIWYLADLPF